MPRGKVGASLSSGVGRPVSSVNASPIAPLTLAARVSSAKSIRGGFFNAATSRPPAPNSTTHPVASQAPFPRPPPALHQRVAAPFSSQMATSPLPRVGASLEIAAPNSPHVIAATNRPRVVAAPEPPHVVAAPEPPRVVANPNPALVVAARNPPIAPLHQEDEVVEDMDPVNDQPQPRRTRGVTKGVKPPKSTGQKDLVTILKDTLLPDKATSKINSIVRRHYTELKTRWSHWKREEIDCMWMDYLRYFRFATQAQQKRGRRVFEKVLKRNFAKYLSGWRRLAMKNHGSIAVAKNHKPEWLPTNKAWEELCDYWMSPAYLKARQLRIDNKAKGKIITHTSGRISYAKREKDLIDTLGRRPTQIEKFTETHRKRKRSKGNDEDDSADNNEIVWVSEDAKNLEAEYASKLREKHGLDDTTPVNAILNPKCPAVLDPGCLVWESTVGGAKKGRLFDRPGEKWLKRGGRSTDYGDDYVDSLEVSEQMQKMKEELELKASIERAENNKKMSDQQALISQQHAYISSLGPILAQLAEKCGMSGLVIPPPPMLNDLGSFAPSSDGASNSQATATPTPDDGDYDGEADDDHLLYSP